MSLNPFIAIIHTQVSEYGRVHCRRANLVLHLLAAPLFWLGGAAVLLGLKQRSLAALAVGAAMAGAALGLQALGHRLEKRPAAPFDSVFDALVRLAAENLYVFPHFLLAGGWTHAWRQSRWQVLS